MYVPGAFRFRLTVLFGALTIAALVFSLFGARLHRLDTRIDELHQQVQRERSEIGRAATTKPNDVRLSTMETRLYLAMKSRHQMVVRGAAVAITAGVLVVGWFVVGLFIRRIILGGARRRR